MIPLRLITGRLLLALLVLLIAAVVVTRFFHRAHFAAMFGTPRSIQLATPLDADAYQWRTRHVTRGCFTGEFDQLSAEAFRRTPILSAALLQDWRSVIDFARRGAAVEFADINGVTPLMMAAKFGNTDSIDALVAAFADVAATDRRGWTALHYAIDARQVSAVATLLARTPLDALRFPDGRDLITAAFATGEWRIIQPVLNRFPQVRAWSDSAVQVLNDALQAKDEMRLRFLMSRHLAPPPLTGSNVPLLLHAIVAGDMELFETLLRCGADVNTTLPSPLDKRLLPRIESNFLRNYIEEDTGVTALMLAAGMGKAELVQALLHAGASRNLATAKYKMLALYFATRSGSYRCSQMLLGGGPSPDELRIEINVAKQSVEVIKGGASVLKTVCSSGREGYSTKPGYYVVTDKDRDHRSTIYKVPMPWFMRLNCLDFGMHEGNVSSPRASHGCIRLPGEVARRLFYEIPIGTVVKIN